MPNPTKTNSEQEWEKFKIKLETRKGPTDYTLDQLINDVELGNALAIDLSLSYEKHKGAFDWLRKVNY